ncbi:radical SAM protein [Methylocystis iwaonis]|uniref:Radical SAM core domain-containing protein n=1 Tax=Methylocystis iwaonis TaxID=2885079 RepID=A0ABN6VBB6_9HYPH|nr:radical SAM protein [Methylocystis iwaonis]BDV32532.1 hypothetical protein SS37A_00610 [Methylocystis iwaonis]
MPGDQQPAREGFPRPIAKFADPQVTAKGERRAAVSFQRLQTLWFNTGTLCNLACNGCYIESSPRNDALVYLTRADAASFLREVEDLALPGARIEIGFTGGEPFMNPDIMEMIEDSLAAGHRVIALTNAMKPMQRVKEALLRLRQEYPGSFAIRVSLDHYEPNGHERIRGPNSWEPAIEGIRWLVSNQFSVTIASRLAWGETEVEARKGFQSLFDRLGVGFGATEERLVLFPEMDAAEDVPEISEGCWSILGRKPDDMMCATSRMVVRRKGSERATVVSCTLLPHSEDFELGSTLAESLRPISLNHVFCARFCVLGGASCRAQPSADV